MPALHYWVNATALFLAGSFLFSALVGVIGLKPGFSRRKYHALWVIALLFTGWAWFTAAKQGEDQERLSADYHRLLDPINRRVSPDQMNAFLEIAKKNTGKKTFVSIVTNTQCIDCETYAEDIRSTLENGGWLATTGASVLGVKYHSPRGLMIGVRWGSKVRPNVLDLTKCLDAAKIPYDLIPAGASASASESQIVMIVMPLRAKEKS